MGMRYEPISMRLYVVLLTVDASRRPIVMVS